MGGVWGQIGLVVLLVAINAAFAGAEMALVSLRDSQLQRLQEESRRGRLLARLAGEPTRFLATIQIGITLAGFLASASAAVSLAAPVEERLEPLGGAAGPVSILLVTLALAYVTLVFGELAPKRLAMQRAERVGLVMARPLAATATITRPAVWLLSASTDLVVRLAGGNPDLGRDALTDQELRDMVAAQPSLSHHHRTLISDAFEIGQRTLRELVLPRPDVFVLGSELSVVDALDALVASGHSRAPVAPDGELDDAIGVVHLRDLVRHTPGQVVRDVAQPTTLFPETALALDALRRMQLARVQLAIVIDEHGAAEGIVTIEDLLEELVGDIYDETDQDAFSTRRLADGSLLVPGRYPLHDLPDIGVTLPEGQYTTLAGFVLAELQRIPERPGDVVETDAWRVEVTGVSERAITELRLTARQVPGTDELTAA